MVRSRDETFQILLGYHKNIFQYVLIIFDGFKDVLEEVSDFEYTNIFSLIGSLLHLFV